MLVLEDQGDRGHWFLYRMKVTKQFINQNQIIWIDNDETNDYCNDKLKLLNKKGLCSVKSQRSIEQFKFSCTVVPYE